MFPVIVIVEPSAVILSSAIFPTLVISLSPNDVAPNELLPVEVIAPQPIIPMVEMFLEPSKTTALPAKASPP